MAEPNMNKGVLPNIFQSDSATLSFVIIVFIVPLQAKLETICLF